MRSEEIGPISFSQFFHCLENLSQELALERRRKEILQKRKVFYEAR